MKKKTANKKAAPHEKPLSLYPLKPKDVLRALLLTKPVKNEKLAGK